MDILINTEDVLRDIVLNRQIDLKQSVRLKRPKFEKRPIHEVDALFNHSHPLIYQPKEPDNLSIDLSKLEFKRVTFPGLGNRPQNLQFAPEIKAKKRVFLDNLKDFNVGTRVNLLTDVKEDIAVLRRAPVEESEEKKQVSEFLRKTFKSTISDFGTRIRGISIKMDKSNYKWAHLVPADKTFPLNTKEMALKLDFQLDTFQIQAIHYLSAHKNVFVAAHTSSGKTVIAEYAIALSDLHHTNTIYTSPIKALSNQKYRDFSKKFTKQKIGLITGDVQINVNYNDSGTNWASSRQATSDSSQPNICTIMTTEILLTMLYRNEKFLKNVEFIVFDECHYINDDSRGYVWEEIFILLPSHITIVMLSATIPNLMEFNEWIGELKSREIYIVKTHRRPIPLEYYVVAPQYVNLGKFQKNSKVTTEDKQAKRDQHTTFGGKSSSLSTQTGTDPFAALIHCTARPTHFDDYKLVNFNTQMDEKLNKGRPMRDAQLYLQSVRFLSATQKLPAVVFVLSRKKCDDLADSLYRQNVNLLNSESERHFVNGFIASQLSKLSKSISGNNAAELPGQVQDMKNYLLNGFACHHSGLLQSLKEIVEILFQMGYVKLLFATETFAIGVNMPTRTVVFDKLQKYDGRSNRLLTPVEFTQMAGRAGRRGQDDFGTVILLMKSYAVSPTDLRHLCLTSIENVVEISTKFQLNYKLLLNVIRGNELPEPKQETFRQKFNSMTNEKCTWEPIGSVAAISQGTMSIEKFLKFNFFEYQKTLKGMKIDNMRVDLWNLLEIVLEKKFFGFFANNQLNTKIKTFFKEVIQPALDPKKEVESVSAKDNQAIVEILTLAVEYVKFDSVFWSNFLYQNGERFFNNGRLLKISHRNYRNRFGLCVGNAYQSKKIKILVLKTSTDNDKVFEKWVDELEKQDDDLMKRIVKFLNRFGCLLWDYRYNKASDNVPEEEDDEEEENSNQFTNELTEEDISLIEIVNGFLKMPISLSSLLMVAKPDEIDWNRVLRLIFNALQPDSGNAWSEKDTLFESIEIDVHEVVACYELVVMAKHDLNMPDNHLKIKLALEREVANAGGISAVEQKQLPWWDELQSSSPDSSEEQINLIKNNLTQKMWFKTFLAEQIQAHADVLHEHFSIGKDSVRFLQCIRTRYEQRNLSRRYQLENLQFYRHYRRKLAVLERLDYVRPTTHELTLKGRMASELSNQKLPNELLLTEIIFNNFVANLTEAELCALLSCALCRAKIDDAQFLDLWQCLKTEHPKLLDNFTSLETIYKSIQVVEKETGVLEDGSGADGDKGGDLNCNLILVVYEWAQGKSYVECKAMTEIQDGIIVRCIQDLIELLRDIRNAAHSVGEPVLFNKINAAINLIKRDIIFAPSLYTL